jgi:peptide/nickel transport system ATP-binding protein
MQEKKTTVLDVQNLTIGFTVDREETTAVDGVSFSLQKGVCTGLVGESGCGKSVSAMSIIRLLPIPPAKIKSGTIIYNGMDLLTLPIDQLRSIRGRDIGVIFQEPMTSLNPVKRIGEQVSEPLRIHFPEMDPDKVQEKTIELLNKVGIPAPEKRLQAYPHELSGGMRQRIMIAIAIICKPGILIADEPTTALDVTIQAQILDLMKHLQQEMDMSILMITHDLGVIAEICQDVIVMYAGRIVETAPVDDLFTNPSHPYTRGLLQSIPRLHDKTGELSSIEGSVPHPRDFLPGCRFAPRCPECFDKCITSTPPGLFTAGDNHTVACWLYEPSMEETVETTG